MRILGFGAVELDTLGVKCSIPAGAIPVASVQHTMIRRVGAPAAFGSASIPERTLPVVFVMTDLGASGYSSMQNAFSALISQLEPTNPTPRQIRAIRNDGTYVVSTGVLQFGAGAAQENVAVNAIAAQFVLTDPLWHATTETVATKTFAEPQDQALRLSVIAGGEVPVAVRLAATTQRTVKTATLGWTKRQIYTITNNANEPLLNYPILINLGNTAALVSGGKVLANGNDLRVWIEGQEVPRTLNNWNAASASGFWFVLPSLPAGMSVEVEVVYGNPNAGTPTTLTPLVNRPPFNLPGSNNDFWVYWTDDVAASAGAGIWGIDGGGTVPPSRASFDLPGAWRRAVTLEIPWPNNFDSFTQNWNSPYVASGTKYRASFAALRAPYAVNLPEWRVADGVALRNPLGITKINVGFLVTNLQENVDPTYGVGKLVVGARNGPGAWTKLLDYTSVVLNAVIAPADYQPATPMKEFMCAVWPRNEGVIPLTARSDRYILGEWNTHTVVTIDSTKLGIALTSAEHDIYQWSGLVATFGDGRSRAWRGIDLGSGGKITTALGEVLRIVPALREVQHWNASLTELIRVIPPTAYAVVQTIFDQYGNPISAAGDAWPAVHVQPNELSNPTFVSGQVAPWITRSVPGTYTVAPLSVVSGRLQAQVTANTGAAGTGFEVVADEFLVLNGRRYIWLAADLQVSNANLRPRLQVLWYGAAGTLISTSREAAYTAVTGSPYRRLSGFVPPVGATQFKAGVFIESVTASQAGTVWIDTVWPYGAEIMYVDAGRGDVEIGAEYLESYP